MGSNEWKEGIQIIFASWTILAIGYLGAILKAFPSSSVSAIRKIVRIAAIPCQTFYYIGINKLETETYKPLFVSFLTLIVIHFIFFLIFIIVKKFENIRYLLKMIIGGTYSATAPYGYALVDVMFGSKFLHIPIMLTLVNIIIFEPFHIILLNHMEAKKNNDDEFEIEDIKPKKNAEVPPSKVDISGNPVNLDGSEDGKDNQPINDESHGEKSNQEKPPSEDQKKQDTEKKTVETKHEENDQEYPIDKNFSLKKQILYAFLNPTLILFILGIIWSSTGWTMMLFMTTFIGDLQKSVVASLLFSAGSYMYDHSFKPQSVPGLLFYIFINQILKPIIALGFSYALGLNEKAAKACVLVHAAPMAITADHMMKIYKMDEGSPYDSFLYTNLLSPIFFIIWFAILNETNIFK